MLFFLLSSVLVPNFWLLLMSYPLVFVPRMVGFLPDVVLSVIYVAVQPSFKLKSIGPCWYIWSFTHRSYVINAVAVKYLSYSFFGKWNCFNAINVWCCFFLQLIVSDWVPLEQLKRCSFGYLLSVDLPYFQGCCIFTSPSSFDALKFYCCGMIFLIFLIKFVVIDFQKTNVSIYYNCKCPISSVNLINN